MGLKNQCPGSTDAAGPGTHFENHYSMLNNFISKCKVGIKSD